MSLKLGRFHLEPQRAFGTQVWLLGHLHRVLSAVGRPPPREPLVELPPPSVLPSSAVLLGRKEASRCQCRSLAVPAHTASTVPESSLGSEICWCRQLNLLPSAQHTLLPATVLLAPPPPSASVLLPLPPRSLPWLHRCCLRCSWALSICHPGMSMAF